MQPKRVSDQALEVLLAERLRMMACDETFVTQILEEPSYCAKDEMTIIEEQWESWKRALPPILQEIANIVRFIAQGRVSDELARELERLEVQKAQIEGKLVAVRSRGTRDRQPHAQCPGYPGGAGALRGNPGRWDAREAERVVALLHLQGDLHAGESENGPLWKAHFRKICGLHRHR